MNGERQRPHLRDCPMCHASGADTDDPKVYFIAQLVIGGGTEFENGYTVQCVECGATVHGESEAETAALWNGEAPQ